MAPGKSQTYRGDFVVSSLLPSVLLGAAVLCICAPVLADDEEPDPVILGIALTDAPMTLQEGRAVSEPHGKPISAKFKFSKGDVQLSVYNAIADGFVETILNPKTDAVIESDADDLAHSKVQKAAMEKATVSPQAATEKAVSGNPDSRAVSVIPGLRDGQAVAAVKLLRQKGFTTVTERLN
jgi:hypothetical protein